MRHLFLQELAYLSQAVTAGKSVTFLIPVCEAFKLQRIFQFLTLVAFLYPGASCGFKSAHLRETDLGKERGEREGDEEKSLAQ